jgi:hypothetical protein
MGVRDSAGYPAQGNTEMNSPTQPDYDYIDSDAELAAFCATLAAASYCAIDTEFIRESTYYPELALIQIASEDQLACIDPLAISDFSPLADILASPDLLKVFHSSSQDLEILYQKFAAVPAPVFDTPRNLPRYRRRFSIPSLPPRCWATITRFPMPTWCGKLPGFSWKRNILAPTGRAGR